MNDPCYNFSVILEAPDTVLIERAQGKRVDPFSGGKQLLFLYFSIAYKFAVTALVKLEINILICLFYHDCEVM